MTEKKSPDEKRPIKPNPNKMKGYVVLLVLCIAICRVVIGGAITTSFEDDKSLSNWHSLNTAKTAIDTVNFHSGKHSLAVFRSVGTNGEPLDAGWESNPIDIQKDTEYTFAGYIATKGATGKTYLSIVWYKAEKYIGCSSSQVLQGDNDWTFIYITAIPPKGATQLRLQFRSDGNNGTAWLDDASFVAKPIKIYNVNLAPNPSFEEGAGEETVLDWGKEWEENADFRYTAGVAHGQARSVRIDGSVKTGGWSPAGWKSLSFPVFKGKRYTFSAWAKTKNATGDTYLVISWYGPNGWICNTNNGFSLTGNNDWTKLFVSDVPPEGATYAVLYLRSDNNNGSAWFDDVALNITEQNLVDIPVPNNSFEMESDFWKPWQSEGHAGNMAIDYSNAYDGKCSLRIDNASGSVAWRSNTLYLDCNTKYQYRFSCKVYREVNSEGKALIWIAWFGKEGWLGNSESVPADAPPGEWQELTVVASPPKGASSAQLFLGCEDYRGSVWFDDVQLEMMCFPTNEEVQTPLEYVIVRHYQSLCLVHPFYPERLSHLFANCFNQPEDCQQILEGLEKHLNQHPDTIGKDLQLTLAILYYHIGDYGKASLYISKLRDGKVAFSTIDIRSDILIHYRYWIEQALARTNAQKKVEEANNLPSDAKAELLLQAGDDYYKTGEFEEARRCYEKLLELSSALKNIDLPSINYKIALCLFKDKRYKEAGERLKDFLSIYPKSNFTEEAKILLVKALRLSGKPEEAITLLKAYLQDKDISRGFRLNLEKEAGKCYLLLKDSPAWFEDYKKTFGRSYLPGAMYIGEDTSTLGDWQIAYGNFAYILCGMHSDDVVGGLVRPVRLTETGSPETNLKLLAEETPALFYSVSTLDPAEPSRFNWEPMSLPEHCYLYDPLSQRYINAFWDDRGETHPFDNKGPDLLITIRDIPPGVYRLALYMREHEVRIMDDEGHILATKPRKEERGRSNLPNLYECFLVFGPIDLTIHIVKGKSLCTLISGIFLDKLSPPQSLPLEVTKGISEEVSLTETMKKYEEMRRKWEEDPIGFYSNLDKLQDIIDTAKTCASNSPQKSPNPLCWWIMGNCYDQLPGNKDKEMEALQSFIEGVIRLLGTEKSKEILKSINDRLTQDNLRQAKIFTICYLKTLWKSGQTERLMTEFEQIFEKYFPIDKTFAREIFENCVSYLCEKVGKDRTISWIKKLVGKYEQNAPCLLTIAYDKIREKMGQKALNAEEQYMLALHKELLSINHQACYQPSLREVLEELWVLLKNYSDFPRRDEVYERIIDYQLAFIPTKTQLMEILNNFEKECPNSPLLPQIYYHIATQYYLQQGELPTAEEFLSLIIQKFPNSGWANYAREKLEELNNSKLKNILINREWR